MWSLTPSDTLNGIPAQGKMQISFHKLLMINRIHELHFENFNTCKLFALNILAAFCTNFPLRRPSQVINDVEFCIKEKNQSPDWEFLC